MYRFLVGRIPDRGPKGQIAVIRLDAVAVATDAGCNQSDDQRNLISVIPESWDCDSTAGSTTTRTHGRPRQSSTSGCSIALHTVPYWQGFLALRVLAIRNIVY